MRVVDANVDEAEAMKFCALDVVALVVDARRVVICALGVNRFVKATVAALNMFAARVPIVAFRIVVDARVEEPVTNRLAAVSVPLFVDDPVTNAVSTPV